MSNYKRVEIRTCKKCSRDFAINLDLALWLFFAFAQSRLTAGLALLCEVIEPQISTEFISFFMKCDS